MRGSKRGGGLGEVTDFLLIAGVGNHWQISACFLGEGKGLIEWNDQPGVPIGSPIANDLRSHRLIQRIAVRAARLLLIPNTTIEIILIARGSPERKMALGKCVIDELGDGAVDALHHGAEVSAKFQVAQGVVVVVEEGGEPGGEVVLICVVGEAVPENKFRFFGGEGVEAVAAS